MKRLLTRMLTFRGAWAARSAKGLLLGFDSGHELAVSWAQAPWLGSAWDALSPSPIHAEAVSPK